MSSLPVYRHHAQKHIKTSVGSLSSVRCFSSIQSIQSIPSISSTATRPSITNNYNNLRALALSNTNSILAARRTYSSQPSSKPEASSHLPHSPQQSQDKQSAMSDKLVPANPGDVMVIRDISPNITTLSVPFLRGGLIEVGGRCTIVRMTGGGVLVFSPVGFTAEAASVVKRLGGKEGVRYLVAPDIEHHIFLSEWLTAYPNARIVAPQGLAEKRAATKGKNPRVNVDDPFFAILKDKRAQPMSEPQSVAPDFDADFGLVYFDMHPNKEIVLLYRPENILIEADLIFNLPAIEQYQRVDAATRRGAPGSANLLNRIFQAVMRTEGDLKWTRRFQWYLASSGDRARFNDGIRVIDAWPFETIIPCHGETITKDAKAVFRRVFEWHLEDKKH